MGILIAAAVIAIISVAVGVLLGVLNDRFRVETDPREEKVRACLAGSNCGGCGYAGCDAYASAIVLEGADPSLCPSSDREEIGKIMGVSLAPSVRLTAFVKCSGSCAKTTQDYSYFDEKDCRIAYLAPRHGAKSCSYGCCGFGTCALVCQFDAIRIIDGLAVVDREKCQACGKCVGVCPNGLIELIPYDASYAVRCSSHAKGKLVRSACQSGCIGCGLCSRVCPTGAISVAGSLASIDQRKCIACGECVKNCPAGIIVKLNDKAADLFQPS